MWRTLSNNVWLLLLVVGLSVMTVIPANAAARGNGHSSCARNSTSASNKWYLAEGSTGSNGDSGFNTTVFIQNPGAGTAHAKLTYQTPNGKVDGPVVAVESERTKAVYVEVPNCWSVSTMVEADRPVTVGREMSWWIASPDEWEENITVAEHYSIGVTKPETDWYLAEGSTGTSPEGNFESWILVQNPGNTPATVELFYQTPNGAVTGQSETLAPQSRRSWNIGDVLPNEWSVSTKVHSNQPVIAERAVYWSTPYTYRECATDSVGVPAATREWYLAEGSTGSDDAGFFETWVLVQNPSTTQKANVQVNYQTSSGKVAGPSLALSPGTRESVKVSDRVANDFDVSTKVTSDKPVVAERSMYWNSWASGRQSAHDSIGSSVTCDTWYVPGGYTFSSEVVQYESWVLVQNPNNGPANINVIYTTDKGPQQGPSATIAPNSRRSFCINDVLSYYSTCSGAIVHSSSPVVVENAIYGNSRTLGMDSIGVPAH